MSPITLRPVTGSDLAAITAIYSHHVQHGSGSFELEPPSAAEMQSRIAAIIAAGYPYWVAVRGNEVLGYAYANHFRTRPAYRFTVEDSIYVAPTAIGQGVGRALLERLIEVCTEQGFRQMLAVIGDSDNAASIAVHRGCGFVHTGKMSQVGWKFGRWLDIVLMQRELGVGGTREP
ncbi:MAG: N-acetyltransferase family protein [Burkholderiaceae bacterium]